MFDIRSTERFSGFDLNKTYEGIVVENSTFNTNGRIQVYIPEMFIGMNNDRMTSTTEIINTSKLLNSEDLKFSTKVELVNYIECLPIVLNAFTIKSLKPKIADTVMVQFINGDVKLAYYLNAHLLLDDEDILKSSNEDPLDNYSAFGYYRIIKLQSDPMTGPDVYNVGTKLKLLGYNVSMVDGQYFYDSNMSNAISLFQNRISLTSDGEVGPITYRMLMRFEA